MLFKIELESEKAIYQQIVDNIILAIAKGELKPNDSLPSVRSFASDLGINLHTVRKAYNILKSLGYISVSRSKGAVILEKKEKIDKNKKKEVEKELELIIAKGTINGLGKEDILELTKNIIKKFKEGEKND